MIKVLIKLLDDGRATQICSQIIWGITYSEQRRGKIDFLRLFYSTKIFFAEFAGIFTSLPFYVCIYWVYFTLGCLECSMIKMDSDQNMGLKDIGTKHLWNIFRPWSDIILKQFQSRYTIRTQYVYLLAHLFTLFLVLQLCKTKRAKIHITHTRSPVFGNGTSALPNYTKYTIKNSEQMVVLALWMCC